jgi:SAM-dependent methyltransferase
MENKLENWNAGKSEELKFWDTWLMSKGGFWKESGYDWTEDFKTRIDPNSELQEYIAAEIRARGIVFPYILDVCAGPLTIVNKNYDGKPIQLKCFDALADDYSLMLDKYGIFPPVYTIKGDVEDNLLNFPVDVVHCSNGLDHSYNPLEGIKSMVTSIKPGGFVILKHYIREGERGSYQGLHQWNFYLKDEKFFISDSEGNETDVEKELAEYNVTCKSRIEGREIITVIS